MIGIVGTKCVHCEQPGWAQVVSISPGWQTYLEQIQEESNKTKDGWIELMLTKGVGICFQCNRIGPNESFCKQCLTNDGQIQRPKYGSLEEVLETNEGVCFNCHKI
jgi:hypothetical protein